MQRVFCPCWPSPLKNEVKKTSSRQVHQQQRQVSSPVPQDEEDTAYGTIPSLTGEPGVRSKQQVTFRDSTSPIVSQSSKSEQQPTSSSVPTSHNGSIRFSIPFFRKRHSVNSSSQNSTKQVPNRELPKPPKKTFSRNVPSIDDPINPTYESIDAENESLTDPLYSKVDDNPSSRRYDYPLFRSATTSNGTPGAGASAKNMVSRRRPTGDEPVYTSASQIYSGGSEDPYSSIVSEAAGPSRRPAAVQRVATEDGSSFYDPGYARVTGDKSGKGGQVRNDALDPVSIDQLYAKINRPPHRSRTNFHPGGPSTSTAGPSTSSHFYRPQPMPVTTSSTTFDQTNESGSGSIISGTSTNPSYRYLTVRETVDVVRERIRQRDEAAANARAAAVHPGTGAVIEGPIREHYYSTIANEYYESVGGGSLNENIYGIARVPPPPTAPVVAGPSGPGGSIPGHPLSLNVARLSGAYEVVPPRPPTSPIPNRQPTGSGPAGVMRGPIHVIHNPPGPNPSPAMTMSLTSDAYSSSTADQSHGTGDRTASNPNLAGPSMRSSWNSTGPMVSGAASVSHFGDVPIRPRIIPMVVMPNTSRMGQRTVSQETVDSSTQTNLSSRIPISTARLNRSQSPNAPAPASSSSVITASTQTVVVPPSTTSMVTDPSRRSQMTLSGMRTTSQNPLPTGRDYVSPVDLGSKRAWPLQEEESDQQ